MTKRRGTRVVGLALAALMMVGMLTACGDSPTIKITNEQDQTQTTASDEETIETKATVAIPEGQLSMSELLGMTGGALSWQELSAYTHTMTDDTHATFAVADGYGKECTLEIAFDSETDTVSEATLSYGDVHENLLTNGTVAFRNIMVAMEE